MATIHVFGERRLHQRKDCAFPVTIGDQEHAYAAFVRNLSLGGALIEAPDEQKLQVGQELVLTLPYRLKKDSFVVKGRIERVKASSAGVVFIREPE